MPKDFIRSNRPNNTGNNVCSSRMLKKIQLLYYFNLTGINAYFATSQQLVGINRLNVFCYFTSIMKFYGIK
jgi:hypothetical protein